MSGVIAKFYISGAVPRHQQSERSCMSRHFAFAALSPPMLQNAAEGMRPPVALVGYAPRRQKVRQPQRLVGGSGEDEVDEPGGADPRGVRAGRGPTESSRRTRYRSVLVNQWSSCRVERADGKSMTTATWLRCGRRPKAGQKRCQRAARTGFRSFRMKAFWQVSRSNLSNSVQQRFTNARKARCEKQNQSTRIWNVDMDRTLHSLDNVS